MTSPRLTTLFSTPVKGFALHSPRSVELDANGAVGDRDFFLVDDQDALTSITRLGAFASWTASFDRLSEVLTLRSADGQTLESGTPLGSPVVGQFYDDRTVEGRVVGGPWSEWLSDLAGREVRLVKADQAGGAFDEHAVTLLSEGSVEELARHTPDGTLDARRFRMLIGFDGVAAYTEDGWNGRTLRIGTAELLVRGPVPRCNATTRHPDTGQRDLKTLRLIEEHRGQTPNDFGEGLNFGVYADVVTPGTITVGDALSLE